MRIILTLSLILTFSLTYAQDRRDTIRMKDGNVILCQILKISEPDSVIQFCLRENGALQVKKVHSAFVQSWAWPGKDQAAKYSKMLGVKNIQYGGVYKGYWYVKPLLPPHDPTSGELSAMEFKKARTQATISFTAMGAGLFSALAIPKMMMQPSIYSSNNTFAQDIKKYDNTVKALRIAGGGVALVGLVFGFSSLNHFTKAKQLRKESVNHVSLYTNRDGLCLAFSF